MKNFHTHTYRCQHAEGDAPDYARAAVEQGAEVLGFSDHIPLPDGLWARWRMRPDEMGSYFAAMDEAERLFPELTIYRGLEGEWIPGLRTYYEEEILGPWPLDYLIGAEHWFPFHGSWESLSELTSPSRLRAYAEHLVKTMETGLFAFIAHPDSFGRGWHKWDEEARACSRDILQAAEELQMPLEINGYGYRKKKIKTAGGEQRKYPLDPFWELAAGYNIEVVLNSDAHEPENVLASMDLCAELAQRCGLKLFDMAAYLAGKRQG